MAADTEAVPARPVYAGVVEHSIHVHPGCQAYGIGRALPGAFIADDEQNPAIIHTVRGVGYRFVLPAQAP
ncbi:hypothetical protein [Nonomuraea sp. SBT364]|uniref:hypothetical protein n=1 Tax=Nonomuraea sp. SBT364 TaxID=1580530 RepID=UPI00069E7F54|nr:hypothetical protein [Nonomuraea sp. SBT364]